MKIPVSIVAMAFSVSVLAQQPATAPNNVLAALKQKSTMQANSVVKNVPFENIGPTIMSGRVVDVAVNPKNPNEFYAAYASGGLWHTTNNGTSFTPILDNTNTQNIGDIAVDWKTRTLWVGTGENNSSRSSYAGIGLMKSTDNGQNWTYLGLPTISLPLLTGENNLPLGIQLVGNKLDDLRFLGTANWLEKNCKDE